MGCSLDGFGILKKYQICQNGTLAFILCAKYFDIVMNLKEIRRERNLSRV